MMGILCVYFRFSYIPVRTHVADLKVLWEEWRESERIMVVQGRVVIGCPSPIHNDTVPGFVSVHFQGKLQLSHANLFSQKKVVLSFEWSSWLLEWYLDHESRHLLPLKVSKLTGTCRWTWVAGAVCLRSSILLLAFLCCRSEEEWQELQAKVG